MWHAKKLWLILSQSIWFITFTGGSDDWNFGGMRADLDDAAESYRYGHGSTSGPAHHDSEHSEDENDKSWLHTRPDSYEIGSHSLLRSYDEQGLGKAPSDDEQDRMRATRPSPRADMPRNQHLMPYYFIALSQYPFQRLQDMGIDVPGLIDRVVQKSKFQRDTATTATTLFFTHTSSTPESREQNLAKANKFDIFLQRLCFRNLAFLHDLVGGGDQEIEQQMVDTLNWLHEKMYDPPSDDDRQIQQQILSIVRDGYLTQYDEFNEFVIFKGDVKVTKYEAKENQAIIFILQASYLTHEHKWLQLFKGRNEFMKYYVKQTSIQLDNRMDQELETHRSEFQGKNLLPWKNPPGQLGEHHPNTLFHTPLVTSKMIERHMPGFYQLIHRQFLELDWA